MEIKPALSGRRRRVFESVFPSTLSTISQTTPLSQSTDGGYSTQASSFSTQESFHELHDDPIGQQAAWDDMWHTVTTFLSIKKSTKIPLQHMLLDRISNDEEFRAKILPAPDDEFQTALLIVLEPAKHLPLAGNMEDIVAWFTQETRRHFLQVIMPHLLRISNEEFVPKEDVYAHGQFKEQLIVTQSLKTLEGAHRLYISGFSIIVRGIDSTKPGGNSKPIIQKYRRDLHAVVSNSVSKRLLAALKATLFVKMSIAVGMPERDAGSPWPESQDPLARPNISQRQDAREELLALVESLHNVGLGGEGFQVVFAELMNECMNDFVQRAFSGAWSYDLVSRVIRGVSGNSVKKADLEAAQLLSLLSTETGKGGFLLSSSETGRSQSRHESWCITELCDWIECVYAPLAMEVLSLLENVAVSRTDVEKWKEMGVSRLAELRTSELFEIVSTKWPDSFPALVDLRTAITTTPQRLKLTEAFSTALQDRLLHPGSSTLQILRTYISMILCFHALDHSKVLLDRVAYPLQLYLFSREDTVRIIITGLLSDTRDANGKLVQSGGDKLVELAVIMNSGNEQLAQKVADEELDWHDMDWVPDPVDAGPGYKRSKSADIIGTLIGVLGSQEVFIKEFQTILGENLLKQDGNFEREIKVLELLKSRFGESPLQSCEVMIKDILDSRVVDVVVRRNQGLGPSPEEIEATHDVDHDHPTSAPAEGLLKPSLHSKILSRLFWPQLHDESFRVPTPIAALQAHYSTGFENLKSSRKLTWLHALGHATVELDLEDGRVVFEEVFTWQATVIWAFEGEGVNGEPISRTVLALVESLSMDESLIRSALSFWTSKLVLHELRKDEYAVLETLNHADRLRSDAIHLEEEVMEAEDQNNMMVQQETPQEKLKGYWPMVQGMLTNTKQQMPLAQIGMMLRVVCGGGFPFGDGELKEFLGGLVVEGKLEVGVGGRYRLKK